jgi:hypothetical protein
VIESRQINNLTIRHKDLFAKYEVLSPDKRILEEFLRWEDAVKFCKNTKDFIIKGGSYEKV